MLVHFNLIKYGFIYFIILMLLLEVMIWLFVVPMGKWEFVVDKKKIGLSQSVLWMGLSWFV